MLVTACGRVGFDDLRADALSDSPSDAPSDADMRPWRGNFTLTAPQQVTELDTIDFETECYVTPDEATMYFSSERPGGLGLHDIYMATRSAIEAPWANVTFVAAISTTLAEGRLSTANGLSAYFWSGRGGNPTIWTVTRPTTSQPFANAAAQLVTALDTPDEEYDPWPSRDDLRLYFVQTVGANDLMIAERSTAGAAFGPPTAISELNTAFLEDNPTLSADELFIVFSSTRPGTLGRNDLYYARRADRLSPFGPATPLPTVNTSDEEAEACLTEGGELYFSSDRPGGAGGFDIYRSRFLAQ